ncbi:MAG: hypothetical protein JWL61_5027 [Gemmatimonadetes bacterium]|nr:hypothetical protein [Gemmatimonadota bacterium]
MKPRSSYIRRSAKPPQREKIPKRSWVKRRNTKRKAREFERAYGSKERVEWVKSLPCCWCGAVGESQNAHTVGGGAGRKADYDTIAPLCWSITRLPCHKAYDQHLGVFAHEGAREYVKAQAAETERRWLLASREGDAA